MNKISEVLLLMFFPYVKMQDQCSPSCKVTIRFRANEFGCFWTKGMVRPSYNFCPKRLCFFSTIDGFIDPRPNCLPQAEGIAVVPKRETKLPHNTLIIKKCDMSIKSYKLF